jgi:hypothetical protein
VNLTYYDTYTFRTAEQNPFKAGFDYTITRFLKVNDIFQAKEEVRPYYKHIHTGACGLDEPKILKAIETCGECFPRAVQW